MKRRALFAALLMMATPLSSGAQQPDAGQTGDEGVKLAFKDAMGQSRRVRQRFTLGVGLNSTSGDNDYAEERVADLVVVERVVGQKAGAWVLRSQLESGTLTDEVNGAQGVVRVANGKVVSAPGAGRSAAQKKALAQLTEPWTSSRSALTGAAPGPKMPSFYGPLVLKLPSKPVKVGESWEVVGKTPGFSRNGITLPSAPLRSTHTLQSVTEENGRRIAQIESRHVGETPAGKRPSMSFSAFGSTRIDLDRGRQVSLEFDVSIGVGLIFKDPSGRTAPEEAEAAIQFQINETELAASQPATKKPAAKG